MKLCNRIVLCSFALMLFFCSCMVSISANKAMMRVLSAHANALRSGDISETSFRMVLSDSLQWNLMGNLAAVAALLVLGAMFWWGKGARERLADKPESLLLLLLGPMTGLGCYLGMYCALWYQPDGMLLDDWTFQVGIGNFASLFIFSGASFWRSKLIGRRESESQRGGALPVAEDCETTVAK